MILQYFIISQVLFIIISPSFSEDYESITVDLRYRGDLAIVVDVSSLTNKITFQKIMKNLIPLISSVNISQEYTHVAVMQDGKEILALRKGTNMEIVRKTLLGLKAKGPKENIFPTKPKIGAIKAMFEQENSDQGRESVRIILYVQDYKYYIKNKQSLHQLTYLKKQEFHIFQMIVCQDSECDALLRNSVSALGVQAGNLIEFDNDGVQRLFVRSTNLDYDMRGLEKKVHAFTPSCQQTITIGQCYWLKDYGRYFEKSKTCARNLLILNPTRESNCEFVKSPFDDPGIYSPLLKCARGSLYRETDSDMDEKTVLDICERRYVPGIDYRNLFANYSISPEDDLNACLKSLETETFCSDEKCHIFISNSTHLEQKPKYMHLVCYHFMTIPRADNNSKSEYDSIRDFCDNPYLLKLCLPVFLAHKHKISEICPKYEETMKNNQTCIKLILEVEKPNIGHKPSPAIPTSSYISGNFPTTITTSMHSTQEMMITTSLTSLLPSTGNASVAGTSVTGQIKMSSVISSLSPANHNSSISVTIQSTRKMETTTSLASTFPNTGNASVPGTSVTGQQTDTSSILPSSSPANHNSSLNGTSAGMAGDSNGMSGTHKMILIIVICGLAVLVIVGLVLFKLERNRRRRGKAEINKTVRMKDLKTDY